MELNPICVMGTIPLFVWSLRLFVESFTEDTANERRLCWLLSFLGFAAIGIMWLCGFYES